MRTIGIVCEYNPFHNGHLDHMKRARSLPEAEYVVCVMSSDFLQRGEPAILTKDLRAETAVRNGADIVFELPSVFSCSSAEFYAFSAVSMMHRLGIVDSIVFGSEHGDTGKLDHIAGILASEPQEYKKILKEYLASGLSYPLARSKALSEHCGSDEMGSIMSGSNNILGIEYIKAIKKLGAPIRPVAVPRISDAYKNEKINGSFPSASAIRREMAELGIHSSKPYLPVSSYEILSRFYKETLPGKGLITMEILKEVVFYRIASLSESELSLFHGVTEGFENRLKEQLSSSRSLEEFIESCSTKRYPRTRIARTLFHILMDIRDDEITGIWERGPLYARILAMGPKGRALVPIIEKNSSIPVFTSLKPFYDISKSSWKELLDLEIKASDIYSAAAGLSQGREFTMGLKSIE